jgi:N utilization substance protein B
MTRAPREVLDEWTNAGRSIPTYTTELVRAVEGGTADIDRTLEANSEEWPVHRMATLDRTILRVACQELRAGLPPAVAINEAVEAANELSSDDSGRFINGVLGKVARDMAGSPSGSG